MRTLYSCLVVLAVSICFLAPGYTQERQKSLADYTFEELMEVRIATTPSKTAQSPERATSVVTIITKEEIARSGARTLYEVLKRVPGFFPTSQATWTLVGSRGFEADGTDHILLLIDGHVQNSIVGQGYQQQDVLPALEKVERIEVIRGPGSVLWGSYAVWGIINIITKDGSEASGSEATVAYGDGDGMWSFNYLCPFKAGDGISGMVSFSYWQSDGFDRPGKTGPGAAWTKEDALNVKGNVEFPWGEIGDWPPIDQHREGYELYAKMKMGDGHQLLARVVESNVTYPWDTWLEKPGADLLMRKAYVEYQNRTEFSDTFTLQSTVYGDILLQNRFPTQGALFKRPPGDSMMQDQSNEELAFGVEFTGDLALAQNNNLKVGTKYVRTKIGPNRDSRFDVVLNRPIAQDDAGTPLNYIGVESGYDNNWAVYCEDIWNVNDGRTTLFAGCRYDVDDFRENKGMLLPRAGVIHGISDDLTVKYVLNTGYLRPMAVYAKTVGVIVDETRGATQDILRVTNSEQVLAHDVQLYWRKDRGYFAATGFYMSISDFITFDANNYPQGYKNVGDANSYGLELEGRYHLTDHLALYGNYSYAKAKLEETVHQGASTNDKDEFLNYPHHIWNVGVDWLLSQSSSLNVHLNGWLDMPIVLPIEQADFPGEFSDLNGETYLDVAYKANRLFGSPVDFTFFVANVFDNTDPLGLAVNNGIWYPRGRNVGMRVSYTW
jgi:outer membrane receptor protein involved in Fe transport